MIHFPGMARGGRGWGRGGSGRRASPDPVVMDGTGETESCGTCSQGVSDEAVGCDRCRSWFHPTSLCLGIADTVIGSIKSNPDAIAFICTQCRSAVSSSVNSATSQGVNQAAFNQLFQTVKKLCESVSVLLLFQ